MRNNSITSSEEKEAKGKLGIFSLTVIGIGATIGSGIFVLIGPGALIAGSLLPFAFLLGGLLSLGVAFIYGEFASASPETGASLNLLFNAYGTGYFSFVTGWLLVFGDISYAALNALGFAFYTSLFLNVNPILVAFIVVLVVFAINLWSTKRVAAAESIVALLLLLGLGAFIFLSFSNWGESIGSLGAMDIGGLLPIFGATAVVYASFIGFQGIASVSGEAKKPEKNIPRSLILSVVIITFVFFIVSYIAISFISPEDLASSKAPLFLVAEKLGSIGEAVILPIAILATLSSLIVSLIVGSRKLHAISKQGFFQKFFKRTNEKGVPERALLLISLTTLLLIVTNSVVFVAYLGNATYLIGISLISLGTIRMKIKRPHMERPFKAPLSPGLPIAVSIISLVILFFVGIKAIFLVLTWSLLGFVFYLVSQIEKERVRYVLLGMLAFVIFIILLSLLVVYLGS